MQAFRCKHSSKHSDASLQSKHSNASIQMQASKCKHSNISIQMQASTCKHLNASICMQAFKSKHSNASIQARTKASNRHASIEASQEHNKLSTSERRHAPLLRPRIALPTASPVLSSWQTDKRDRRTDRQTDRQTDRHVLDKNREPARQSVHQPTTLATHGQHQEALPPRYRGRVSRRRGLADGGEEKLRNRWTKSYRNETDLTEPDRTGPDRTEPNRTGPDRI